MPPTRRDFVKSVVGTAATTALSPQVLRTTNGPRNDTLNVALFLDVEDIFSPAEVGNDDSIKELAIILSQEGLRANFMVIGDRAQLLAERGRKDVIDSLQLHDIGLHGRSARHPAGAEYLQGKNWDDGVAECFKRDREGCEIIRSVFGKPCVALSAHSVYDSPHAQRSAGLLGVPYVYGYPAAPPLYTVSWYATGLGFPYRSPRLDAKPFLAYFDGFDDNYPDTARFDSRLKDLDQHINSCLSEGQPFLALFVYHPQKVRLADFIDSYWCPNGINYPRDRWGQYGTPARRTPEQIRLALSNFRRLARWIRMDRRLNVMTVSELSRLYGRQLNTITREDLVDASEAIVKTDDILMHPRFSPAEIVSGLARSVLEFKETKRLPGEVSRTDVVGPVRGPIWIPELRGGSQATFIQLTHELHDRIQQKGQLPATVGRPLSRVGVNHMYLALARNFLAACTGTLPEETRFDQVRPYPKLGELIALSYLGQLENGAMDPDTEGNALYRDGKLQSWTLKPAIVA